jgi:ribosome-associated protein
MKTPDLKTICFEALDDLKAQNILVLDIRDISGFADWFIIATASSSRNAKAISNKLIESLKLQQHQLSWG